MIKFTKAKIESERIQKNMMSQKLFNIFSTVSSKMNTSINALSPEMLLGSIPSFNNNEEIVLSENLIDLREVVDDNIFLIEKYSDEEIKDIISIFKNDFKAPKNLWIENRFSDIIMLEDEVIQEVPQVTEGSEELLQ